jgi:ABC-type amino acid transport substrate-binding protein
VRLYDTVENHNLDLIAGRLDGVIAQRIFMSNWLESDEGQGYEMKGEAMLDPDILGLGAGIAVRKDDNDLLERLDAALTADHGQRHLCRDQRPLLHRSA